MPRRSQNACALWVFRLSNDHLRQYDYARENRVIEVLATPSSARMEPGDEALLWMNKTKSPFREGGFDGRAIFARGVIERITPSRQRRELVERYRQTSTVDSLEKLRSKQAAPHAEIRINGVLSPDRVIRFESLEQDEPELLDALCPGRQTVREVHAELAQRIDRIYAIASA